MGAVGEVMLKPGDGLGLAPWVRGSKLGRPEVPFTGLSLQWMGCVFEGGLLATSAW